MADGGCKGTKSAAITTGYGLFTHHPWFATATRGHRSSSPLVRRVTRATPWIGLLPLLYPPWRTLACCAVLLLDHQARDTNDRGQNEGSRSVWSVQAWTAENEPGYVQAMCWQATTWPRQDRAREAYCCCTAPLLVVYLLVPDEFELSVVCIQNLLS